MKNKLFRGLFGFGIALLLFAVTTSVYANTYGEGNGWHSVNGVGPTETQDISISVGDVDVPVYRVAISWSSMSFNYKYNEEISAYQWEAGKTCYQLISRFGDAGAIIVTADDKNNAEELYDDSSCSVPYTGNINEDSEHEIVYATRTGGKILIEDNSTYGAVIPSFHWEAEDDYTYIRPQLLESVDPATTYDVAGGHPSSFVGCTLEGNIEKCYNWAGNLDEADVYSTLNQTKKYEYKLTLQTMMTEGQVNPNTNDSIGQLTISLTAVQ
ncbi:MAG: hypothetical protein IJO43_02110 [Bacilli bacterium]|nr:hypothetical protein [Bacilli bacterium]